MVGLNFVRIQHHLRRFGFLAEGSKKEDLTSTSIVCENSLAYIRCT
jgi:hypothetical protein